MREGRLGGTAMIASALAGLLTMALHPTGHDVARGQGALNLAVHSLALASVPLSLYGAFALTRRLWQGGELAGLALAFYGASAVATILAATASGFLATPLITRLATLEGDARLATEALLRYNHMLNQAFAQLSVAGSSMGIGLWSVAILRTRLMRRSSGLVGCVVAAATLVLLLSGHLRLDIHGFGAVVLAQAVWLVMVGLELRGAATASTARRG